jgi:hypothetical protein
MIDLTIEQPLTLREATQLPALARNGRKPHISALYRWCTAGVRGVVLESIVVGGSRCTTAEAVKRWIAALTAAANGHASHAERRTPLRRQREHDRAETELKNAAW